MWIEKGQMNFITMTGTDNWTTVADPSLVNTTGYGYRSDVNCTKVADPQV
jgi:hypothetical protein